MLTWHLFTNDQTVLFEQSGQTVLLQTQCLIIEAVDKIQLIIVFVGLTANRLWKLALAHILNILPRCAEIPTGLIGNACARPLIMCFDLYRLSGPLLTIFGLRHEIRLEARFYA